MRIFLCPPTEKEDEKTAAGEIAEPVTGKDCNTTDISTKGELPKEVVKLHYCAGDRCLEMHSLRGRGTAFSSTTPCFFKA